MFFKGFSRVFGHCLWLLLLFLFGLEVSAQRQLNAQKIEERIQRLDHVFNSPVYFPNYQPKGFINDMEVDHEGFLWIGEVFGGLTRFDGKQLKNYYHDPNNSNSLSNSSVVDIYVDSLNNWLWVGTEDGLNILDLKTEKFRRYLPAKCNVPASQTRAIFRDRQERMWVGSRQYGLLEYHVEEDTFIQKLDLLKTDSSNSRSNYIKKIIQDRSNDSILWLGTLYGLFSYNKINGHYEKFVFNDPKIKDPNTHVWQNTIYAIYQHHNGKIYTANHKGLNIFDPSTLQFEHINPYGVSYTDPKVTSYYLRTLGQWSANELYITLGDGLVILDLTNNQVIKRWTSSPKIEYKILRKDQNGNAWAATWTNGITLYPANPKLVKYNFHSASRFQDGFTPRAILEDEESHTLYICAEFSDGLYQFKPSTGEWKLIPPTPEYFNKKSTFKSFGGVITSDGKILISEEDQLFMLSEDKQELIKYPLQPDLENPNYQQIIEDRLGNLWVASKNHGVLHIMPQQDSFILYKEELSTKNNPKHYLGSEYLFEDSRGNIWIRVYKGFKIYQPEQDTFLSFEYQQGSKRAFLEHGNFVEDKAGNIWTPGREYGLGIIYANQLYTGIDTILFADRTDLTNLNYVSQDEAGNIWVNASERGRIVIDPNTFRGTLITGHWIKPNFLPCYKLLSDGQMAIGFRNGIGIFDPNNLPSIEERPRPYLKSLLLNNKPFSTDSSLLYQRNLELNYDQNFLTFQFGAIANYDSKYTRIKYRLIGSHDKWFEPDESWQASYSNLAPGKYVLEIIAENNAGLTSEIPYRLSIFIVPPWWRSNLAFVCYGLTFIGLLYLTYSLQLKRKLIKAEADRLKELDLYKTRMYTNITHEFRTPLTIILGMADEILNSGSDNLKSKVQLIRKNGDQLLQLINQLLDLRKLETGNLQLKLQQGDLAKYLNYIVESFQSLAGLKNIRLIFYADPESLPMTFDEEKIKQIVSNLLSNALKFTPEYGKINVGLSIDHQSKVVIKVKDTGVGMTKDEQERVFDRFFQVDQDSTRKHEGTGIGLALTQELVHLMDGIISVESAPGQGSLFMVKIPYDSSMVMQQEVAPYQSLDSNTSSFHSANHVLPQLHEGPLVLIVEDNQDVIYYLQSILGETYSLVTAFDGSMGIEKAQELIPDIIITDMMMPKLDGLEMTKALRVHERTSHIPIIMLTAKVAQQDKLEGLDRGVDAYISKPFHKQELLIRIQRLLESRQQLREKFAGDIGLLNLETTEDADIAFIKRLNQTIEKHFSDEQFGVQQLCRLMAMSRTQLHRKITALTNQSTSEWIRRVRINKAKVMLLNTQLPIGEVAIRVGFKDQSHFSKVFQQAFDVTPSQFRKSLD